MQALDEVQATPSRAAPFEPEGLGVAWMDHEVPFHASAKMALTSVRLVPTAMQALAEVHATANRPFSCRTLGSGVVWMDHEVPFHASTRVTSTIELSRE